MTRFLNARDIKDQYFSFDIHDGRFRHVRILPGAEPVPAGAVSLPDHAVGQQAAVVDCRGATIVPGALDIHVHSRDPGLTHKETWKTLAAGAFKGGVTAVADMPNTIPPMMTRAAVLEKARIAAESGISFRLLLGVGASNIGEIAGLMADPDLPLCGLKVFYGRTTGDLMYDDLETLGRSLPADGSRMIVFHSEDQCTVDCNHERLRDRLEGGSNSDFRVHSEIRSSEAAHASTRTILAWAAEYGRPVHIAHVSTAVEIELIAEARAKGAHVTSEVAPHHLLFSTDDYERLGPLVKMNPPLRSRAEVDALVRLVGAGLVDVFATDHAPHLLSEKFTSVGRSPSGVPAVEFYYPLLFEVARISGLSPEQALAMAVRNPARLFGFQEKGGITDGLDADFVELRREPWQVSGKDVVSKCGWTPYDGFMLPVRVINTWARGRCVFRAG